MSTLSFERTVRPSVLDRLIDDPDHPREVTWDASVAAFRAAVMRDLQWLLNTRRVHPLPPKELELVRQSIYTFGIRDLSSRSADAANVRAELQREIQDAIATFEPRLTRVHVSLVPEGKGGPIRFNIEAELRTDPTPEAVKFETMLDVASKAIVVTESSDA
jgi:type VI secretion system protein ImpF